METPSRRERIEAMLAEEPQDQFLRYSLAMEWHKQGDHERGLAILESLMADETPLVAAFFMAGQNLAGLQRFDEARSALRRGIEAARQQGDSHAASEMSEYLMRLGEFG